ncbi:restriction endonuclease subunit S [Natrialba sp. INN-245]|uniref:restriction endonuclease subunit S n=1 Tax=Natrialba sp. INN-245 TaxID=2690967 RepID=UPI0013119752|nr:restriction endonuclease subunit S [Natrialba sp. INN-245]MWV38387.1 hypothetical protein [Natrialba sp. INN-245]
MSEQVDLADYADPDSDEDSGWEEKRLGEIFGSVYSGGTPKKGVEEYYDGKLPFVKIEDLNEQQGKGVSTAEEYISEEAIEETSARAFDPGTLLLTIYGSLAETAIARNRLATNQAILGLWDAKKDNVLYVRYAIDQTQPKLKSLSRQTTQANLGKGIVKKHCLPLPPLSEQRKIATVLYTVDQAIRKTEEIIEQSGRVREATEQDLFREGYFDYDQIEEQRLVEYPADWDFEQLSDHTVESAFGPRYDSDRYDETGGIATLRTTDLDRRGNITHETMPRADLDIEEFEKHLLEKGDLIVSRSGAYSGITTTWDGHEIPTIPGAYMIRFRLEDTLNPEYLRYYFNSNVGRRRINRRKKGSGQQNISGSDLLNMRIPIPSKEEQEKIVEVINSIESQIRFNKEYHEYLERLKQGLMQDLLSGAVRTTDTNIEIPDEIAQHG